ncbi:MAG: LuxR family transcriptional regulator [Sphingobium sp.]
MIGQSCLTNFMLLARDVVAQLRHATAIDDIRLFMESAATELGFRYFALIHHEDLSRPRPGRVDIKHYPAAITERLFGQCHYRRDPIIRGCIFADSAFLWSDLDQIISLDGQDRACFEMGKREGLKEGITVPYMRLGECMGSCTFAGCRTPQHAAQLLGPVQIIGIFAFQAARRLTSDFAMPIKQPRLHPRPRDCVILLGQGYTNKQIARALCLAPKTVDCYLAEARKLFGASGRAELVVSAVLAGEIGLNELKQRQPG